MIFSEDRTIVSVDLDKLVQNYHVVRNQLGGGVEIAAAVKANAYGLGREQVVRALSYSGCKKFCVASLQEALEFDRSLEATTYILHGVNSLNMARECAASERCIPVLNHLGQIEHWNQNAKSLGRKLKAVIQIDTGMSRFGLTDSEVQKLVASPELIEALDVEYIMSHMSCAEQKDHPMTRAQLALFDEYRRLFPGIRATFSNSAGVFLGADFHFDMVRPGCALYGINPTSAEENPMQHVVALYGYVVQRRTLDRDQYVGYRAQYKARKGDKLFVVECGYADGYVRSLSNKGICYVDGYYLPVAGIISMDAVVIDASCLPESLFDSITHVEMLGEHIKIDDIARYDNTISYEILTTRLGSRGKRVYLGETVRG